MRGKVWLTIYVVDVHGITPAYAGKSSDSGGNAGNW